MIKNSYKSNQKIYEAEVIESSTIDSNVILKILIKAGRSIAKPALEVLEMAIDPLTPTNVRISLIAALAYLITSKQKLSSPLTLLIPWEVSVHLAIYQLTLRDLIWI